MWFRYFILVLFFIGIDVSAQEIRFKTSHEIVPCDESICLKITTTNYSEQAMYFPPWERLVEIKDAKGRIVRERGPIVEFPVLELTDYKKLLTGEKNIEIIDLRKSYRLDGRGKYTIRFGSGYYDPLKHKYHDKPISTISFTF